MKVWSFIFPSPESRYVSARVAADDRISAMTVVMTATHTIDIAAGRDPEELPNFILQYAGECDANAPAVLRLEARS